MATDAAGDVFVADTYNNRVIEYFTPLDSGPLPGSGDTIGDLALGQADLNHNMVNLGGPRAIGNPVAVAVDQSGHLYVADSLNARLLGFNNVNKFVNGGAADVVIGQPDFYSYRPNNGTAVGDVKGVGSDSLNAPCALAADLAGNVYVSDCGNNRVLVYSAPFNSCASFPCAGIKAMTVFGQSNNFTTTYCNGPNASPSADTLCGNGAIAVDSAANVYIADQVNSRVLEYDTPLTSGTTATRVFGQNGSFTSGGGCNNGTLPGDVRGLGPDSLCGPAGVALDPASNLYVVDQGNNRVLEYNTPLARQSGVKGSGDTIADLVFGQNGSFTSTYCGGPIPGPGTLCAPNGVAVDLAGDVYIADNIRVLEYNTPLSTDTLADMVFGTNGSFTASNYCNIGAGVNDVNGLGPDSLCFPQGVALDLSGNLFVADSLALASLLDHGNRRVLEFDQSIVAQFTVKPTKINFDEVAVGASSIPKEVTLTDAGSTGGLIQNISVSGPFAIVSNGCPKGMAPGNTCQVAVTFNPTATGTQTGLLSFADNGGDSPQTVTLFGTGR